MSVRLPWFRVHIVLLTDPGRLLSAHLMHTGLVSGWAGSMLLFELTVYDSTDLVYNPMWRQSCFVLPFATRLGVTSSSTGWSLGGSSLWTYDSVVLSHILLSGLLVLSSWWHWNYAELDVFVSQASGHLVLDLPRVFGVHLSLASFTCLLYGLCHLAGGFGPGMWCSDQAGLLGTVRAVSPSYSLVNLSPSCYGVIPSNHTLAGLLGTLVGIWHLGVRPNPPVYTLVGMGNIESVLSSSIAAVFFIAYLVSSTMWYSGVTTPVELLGPSRYQWDNAFFSLELASRVKSTSNSWNAVPDKLVLYDDIGCNPAKGGLFRSGPMIKGDGLAQSWVGHAYFEMGTLSLTVRRMPAFFETFPVLLVDQGGTLRSDIPFRRAESLYSIEQCNDHSLPLRWESYRYRVNIFC